MSDPLTPETSADLKADPIAEGPAAAKARKMRSLVIALALIAFVILVFAVTMAKLAGNAAHPAMQTLG